MCTCPTNIQSLEGVYKVTQIPTLQMNKVDLWTCGSTTHTRVRGVMLRFVAHLVLDASHETR